VETPAAIDKQNFMELTSGKHLAMIEDFFALNKGNPAIPKVYFIRHKKRSQLKRVEFCLCDATSGDEEVLAALWTDA
jgi:hypothetical protein